VSVSNPPRRESGWRVLPPTEARRARSPAALEHEKDDEDNGRGEEHGDEAVGQRGPGTRHGSIAIKKESKSFMAVVWTILAILAGIVLVLGAVVLMIHCLAWFIVYQTEARLGEARRGLLAGGEMRLCLCGRG
jgi:hypothetical protein